MMEISDDWVTFVIASLFLFAVLCIALVLRKKCSQLFCAESDDANVVNDARRPQQRRRHTIHPRLRETELQRLRLEQLQVKVVSDVVVKVFMICTKL